MVCAAEGRKYYWRVIDYLQRDAKRKGILRGNEDFGSFWHNIGAVTDKITNVFIAVGKQNRVMGYMVAKYIKNGNQEYDEPHVEIIEVFPQFRRRGVGTAMMRWAIEQTRAWGAKKMSLDPLYGKEKFFTLLGFKKTDRQGSGRYVLE